MNSQILRKFAYKKDQNGIINRYLREEKAWAEHLKNTRDFIIQAAENKEKSSCVILGSGWLLDVPIEKLNTIFDKIYLVDIVHPKQITHKFRKNEKIVFVEADISGYLETTYRFIKENKKKPETLINIKENFAPELTGLIKSASMVVSVNILNQLDILICDYITKLNIYPDDEINRFRKIIQQTHLDLLPQNKSCIITDYEELNYDDNMKLIKTKPLVYTNLPKTGKLIKWRWNFDMHKTYHRKYKTVFKVMAWEK